MAASDRCIFYLYIIYSRRKTCTGFSVERRTMKITSIFAAGIAGFLAVATTGCRSDSYVGSPYQPGPVAGTAIGTGVGAVAGNAVGFGAGVVQGTVGGAANALDPSYRMVRQWRTETTADGRVIQVPYDIMVDQNGRPVNAQPPTGNPAPPPATNK